MERRRRRRRRRRRVKPKARAGRAEEEVPDVPRRRPIPQGERGSVPGGLLSRPTLTPGSPRAAARCAVSLPLSPQVGIVALGKAHTHSAPSLSSLPKVALETVPIFVWLNTDRSRPWRVECRPLPFSTPLSFRRSVL